jgi:hypothetical protein
MKTYEKFATWDDAFAAANLSPKPIYVCVMGELARVWPYSGKVVVEAHMGTEITQPEGAAEFVEAMYLAATGKTVGAYHLEHTAKQATTLRCLSKVAEVLTIGQRNCIARIAANVPEVSPV